MPRQYRPRQMALYTGPDRAIDIHSYGTGALLNGSWVNVVEDRGATVLVKRPTSRVKWTVARSDLQPREQ